MCVCAYARVVYREELCSVEGLTFDSQAEDMRHVWIPLSLKMCISKSQGLEVSCLSEGEEVRNAFSLFPTDELH